jgi:hypothetical protein
MQDGPEGRLHSAVGCGGSIELVDRFGPSLGQSSQLGPSRGVESGDPDTFAFESQRPADERTPGHLDDHVPLMRIANARVPSLILVRTLLEGHVPTLPRREVERGDGHACSVVKTGAAEELPPHVQISLDRLRGRRPSFRESPVGIEPIPGERGTEPVESVVPQELVTEGGVFEIRRERLYGAIRAHLGMNRVAEVDGAQEYRELGEVLREPEVVIADLGHVIAASSAQRQMAVCLADALPLGICEHRDTRIARRVLFRAADRRLGRSIADHEQLEITKGLREDRLDRVWKRRGRTVDGQQHGEAWHGLSPAARYRRADQGGAPGRPSG